MKSVKEYIENGWHALAIRKTPMLGSRDKKMEWPKELRVSLALMRENVNNNKAFMVTHRREHLDKHGRIESLTETLLYKEKSQ
jgi:hypothetical protein